jgi:hypothetical protein
VIITLHSTIIIVMTCSTVMTMTSSTIITKIIITSSDDNDNFNSNNNNLNYKNNNIFIDSNGDGFPNMGSIAITISSNNICRVFGKLPLITWHCLFRVLFTI